MGMYRCTESGGDNAIRECIGVQRVEEGGGGQCNTGMYRCTESGGGGGDIMGTEFCQR